MGQVSNVLGTNKYRDKLIRTISVKQIWTKVIFMGQVSNVLGTNKYRDKLIRTISEKTNLNESNIYGTSKQCFGDK